MDLNLNKIKVFKVTAALLIIIFPVSFSACKEPPPVVEEQEEKPVAEVPSETIQEDKEETPPVIEEKAPGPIEWEVVIVREGIIPVPEINILKT